MSDEQRPDQSDLVQSGNRGLTARSSALVRRGLETLLAQQTRIVHFPSDRSMGTLYMRNLGDSSEGWKEIGEAFGNIAIPAGRELYLKVSREASSDLSPLTSLAPDDLQGLDLLLNSSLELN